MRPRQLILCCDGTNNNLTGGHNDTNVVKLCRLLAARDDDAQTVFYDPGVGNPGELPGATQWDKLRRSVQRCAGLAFGRGVYENMSECYHFLMTHYRPGDQICVFGFSRGAFTARSVAGLVNQFGILRPHMVSMLPTLLHVYFAERGLTEQRRQAIAADATALFAAQEAQRVEVHFVGVWDTVASVGMWPFAARFTASATVHGKRFRHVRQALALDEHRAQFAPRLYLDDNGDFRTQSGQAGTLQQLWFRGAHCDVGGGYTAGETGLSDAALCWLLSEASHCGVRLGPDPDVALTEAQVRHLLIGPDVAPLPVRVHSELRRTPLWALTGMSVRTPALAESDGAAPRRLQAQAHPIVAQQAARFPQDTAWRRHARPLNHLLHLLPWCLALVFLYVAVGQLLVRDGPPPGIWPSLQHAWQYWPAYVRAQLDMAGWQLGGWAVGGLQQGLTAFSSPRWAMAWDVAFIAVYAHWLATFATSAFARLAGLRQVDDGAPPRLLRWLGWALPLAVLADLAENAATWATLTLVHEGVGTLAVLAAVAMSVLSALKWAGLLGVGLLCAWAAGRRQATPV